MPSFILAIDQGTTSSRAIIFDHAGTIRAVAQREFPQVFPKAGWVEHDPNQIWSSQIAVVNEAINNANIKSSDLAAIGITNQRETTVIWDRRTGEPIHNAIVWQDRRTAEHCDRLKAGGASGAEDLVRGKTGLVIDPYFSATKIAWLLDNIPGARRRAEQGELAFGTIDTWLVWKLTSGAGNQQHITDASNASRTMLYNIHTGCWDDELLDLFKVPRAVLPEVRPSSARDAEVTNPEGPVGVPISGIAGDQQAALFGQACHHPGMTKNTYGTGCFMLQSTGAKPVASKHGLLTTIAWQLSTPDTNNKPEYALEGGVFIGGAIVQWLRDGLGIIRSSDEIEKLALSVPDSGGVVVVPALAGLGAPHWDPYARGLIIGLTRATTSAHIARAALEGVAFEVADLLDAMNHDSGAALSELRVDGGASVNNLFMQFQADVLGVPIVRSGVAETTALGAAYLAGLAVGFWKSRDEIARLWRAGARFEPRLDPSTAKSLRARWSDAVERSKHWERP